MRNSPASSWTAAQGRDRRPFHVWPGVSFHVKQRPPLFVRTTLMGCSAEFAALPLLCESFQWPGVSRTFSVVRRQSERSTCRRAPSLAKAWFHVKRCSLYRRRSQSRPQRPRLPSTQFSLSVAPYAARAGALRSTRAAGKGITIAPHAVLHMAHWEPCLRTGRGGYVSIPRKASPDAAQAVHPGWRPRHARVSRETPCPLRAQQWFPLAPSPPRGEKGNLIWRRVTKWLLCPGQPGDTPTEDLATGNRRHGEPAPSPCRRVTPEGGAAPVTPWVVSCCA